MESVAWASERKDVLSGLFFLLTLMAYLSLVSVMALSAIREAYPEAKALPPLAPPGEALRLLLAINFGVLCWRLTMRAACTWVVYGTGDAARSIPRALVGNAINIFAAIRALGWYIGIALRIARPHWEHTTHRFPDSPALAE